ncbi:hypothetical protein EGW08_018017 [Elysia chlorotica]|uniref:RFX1-4/6/8-like BCD domain-containing protein n=1 Tax=Elysia chlorotica TaxID=188477 RepID=A0A433SY45_ELYCH|nr:hypothetical protein EGW08_018017 [Elysia chlorotica]
MLHPLLCKIWEQEQVPEDKKRGHLVKLSKKVDLSSCGNWRGTMLLSTPGQVLAKIMLERLKIILTRGSEMSRQASDKIPRPSSRPSQRERAGRFLMQWTMSGALVMKDLTLNNAKSFCTSIYTQDPFLHLMKLTLDEYVLLVLETQADRERQAQLQAGLQAHMKNTEEINMNAKVRSSSKKSQSALKSSRKRKVAAGGGEDSAEDIEMTSISDACHNNTSHEELLCPTSGHQGEEPHTNPAYLHNSQCPSTAAIHGSPDGALPSHDADISNAHHTSSPHFSSPPQTSEEVSRPEFATNSLPNSTATLPPGTKGYSSAYERTGAYIPSFHFNTAYADYVNQSYSPASICQPIYSAVDQAPQQHYSFHHPVNYNVAAAVNHAQPAPHPYWANNNHAAPVSGDLAYHHLPYTHRTFSPPYDLHKREGLQQPHQDSGLDSRGFIARPTPSYDHSGRQAAMYYHSRQHDSFHPPPTHPQAPVGSHMTRQDSASSLFWHDEALATAIGATSGFSGFRKSYLPASFM